MPTETPAKLPVTPAAKPAESAPAEKPAEKLADKSPEKPTDKPTDKPTEKPIDRFRPEMPNIPGVSGVRLPAPPSANTFDSQRLLQILGAVAAIAVVALSIAWWVRSASRKSAELAPSEAPAPEAPLPPLPSLAVPAPSAGPKNVATVEELSKPWSAKKFMFQKPATNDEVPAIIVRLPGGALWGFALLEPYGKCELQYLADTAQLAAKYNFQASHPMVVNPCNSTVYDPLKVGPLGDNTWARGEVVQGSGLRPPLSIDVVVRGHSIFADRME